MTNRKAYSIVEFCAAHGISRASFYKLPESQRPRIMRVLHKQLITEEAAADWRRMMERISSQEDCAHETAGAA